MRSAPALLWFSIALELLVVFRPAIESNHPGVRLFGDLFLQSVLLFAVPAAWQRWVRRERLADVGVTWANPREWLGWLGALVAIAVPIALGLTRLPAIHHAYPLLRAARAEPWLLVPSTVAFALFGFAWEFFFRGFLLMGMKTTWGRWSILIQALPCALMHVGKPGLELVASLPAALFLGAVAYRTRSVVPGFLLHAWVALVVNLGCVFWPLQV
jgi:uncharacterized protein